MTKRRGIVELIPLAIGLAIALIVIVSVTLPMLNVTLYHFNTTGAGTTALDGGFTGATGLILTQLVPLAAVISIAAVAIVLMQIFRSS